MFSNILSEIVPEGTRKFKYRTKRMLWTIGTLCWVATLALASVAHANVPQDTAVSATNSLVKWAQLYIDGDQVFSPSVEAYMTPTPTGHGKYLLVQPMKLMSKSDTPRKRVVRCTLRYLITGTPKHVYLNALRVTRPCPIPAQATYWKSSDVLRWGHYSKKVPPTDMPVS